MLAKKKDAELSIIKGLHSHDWGHEVNDIYPKQTSKQINIEPCHTCNGPHLVKDCNKSTSSSRCKPILNNHSQT